MVKPTSQTEDTDIPSSEAEGVLDRVKKILSPFRIDRWLAVAVYGSLTTIGLAIGMLAWNWADLQTNPSEQSKRRFDASLSVVSTGATLAAGIVLFLNFRVANRNAEIAQKKLDEDLKKAERDEKLAQSRLTVERFNKAVEMLGKNDSIHLRLGGIYALESIAADSNKDAPDENYRQVLEVLTAFVRENAPHPPKEQAKQVETQSTLTEQLPEAGEDIPEVGENTKEELPPLPTDIQAVLTFLNRRKHKDKDWNWEQYRLDLRKADLRRADLKGASLQKALLRETNLQEADLEGANLQKADLREANLQKANLWRVNLQKADLREADLQEANLWRANLQKADLGEANLQEIDLTSANLQGTNLDSANLQQASLRKANFQEARLRAANLQEAYLVSANLQQASLDDANLQKADLVYANLQKADLTGANLQKADLRAANLQETRLERANLQEASLTGANLRGASFWAFWLTETALAEAKKNAIANLQSAQGWETAQYDPEIREWLGLPPETLEAE